MATVKVTITGADGQVYETFHVSDNRPASAQVMTLAEAASGSLLDAVRLALSMARTEGK